MIYKIFSKLNKRKKSRHEYSGKLGRYSYEGKEGEDNFTKVKEKRNKEKKGITKPRILR